jgi:hypothetical protein
VREEGETPALMTGAGQLDHQPDRRMTSMRRQSHESEELSRKSGSDRSVANSDRFVINVVNKKRARSAPFFLSLYF